MTNITDCDCNDEIDAKYISSQVLGYIGAAIVISFNIPQVVKMVKNKSSKNVAASGFILQVLLCLINVTYGILIEEFPIIVANSLSGIICIIVLVLKKAYDKDKSEKKVKQVQEEQ